jgi:hypothetical protein
MSSKPGICFTSKWFPVKDKKLVLYSEAKIKDRMVEIAY